jgi:hypothetical protein
MGSLRLVPVSGPPIDVVKDPSMVGREPTCEIVVTDGSVSRRHARLERRGPAWWVVDQGSANGTYINSLKVTEQALRNNQELRFGALAFRVDIVEDEDATVATPIIDDSSTVMAPAAPPPPPPEPTPPPPVRAAPPAAPPPHAPAPPPPHAAPHAPPPPPHAPGAAPARERPRPQAAPVPQMPAPPHAPPGKGPLVWIGGGCSGCLLLIVALIAAFWGAIWFATGGPREAAQAWVGHLQAKDLGAARAGMTDAFGERTPDAALERLASATGSRQLAFGLRSGRTISLDNDSADLSGVLRGTGGPVLVDFHMVKVDGRWKVDGVRVRE